MKREKSGVITDRMKRFVKPAAVLAAAALLIAGAFAEKLTVQAVDLEKRCQLTVQAGNSEILEELKDADVVIDLYRIADAEKDTGSDSYHYRMRDGYEDMKPEEAKDNAGWKALAQEAAKAALVSGTPEVKGAAAGSKISQNDDGTDVTAGLYLVIAHGAILSDYTKTVTAEDGSETIVTTAYTTGKEYRFAPELVSLPSKEADENGVVNTANPGEWLYDLEVTLKPEAENLKGALAIVKTLESYEASEPATFVFSVEATLNGETVYSDMAALHFTAAGQQRYVIEDIPAGAVVTVEEIYHGASYTLVTEGTQTVTISAEEVAEVQFTNRYDEQERHGHGITNHFEYSEADGWSWETSDGSME